MEASRAGPGIPVCMYRYTAQSILFIPGVDHGRVQNLREIEQNQCGSMYLCHVWVQWHHVSCAGEQMFNGCKSKELRRYAKPPGTAGSYTWYTKKKACLRGWLLSSCSCRPLCLPLSSLPPQPLLRESCDSRGFGSPQMGTPTCKTARCRT